MKKNTDSATNTKKITTPSSLTWDYNFIKTSTINYQIKSINKLCEKNNKHYFPNLVIVTYNNTDLLYHRCFDCQSRFIPDNIQQVFCSYCKFEKNKIPKENWSFHKMGGVIVDHIIEVNSTLKRSVRNNKKSIARDWFICRYCGYTPFFQYEGIEPLALHADHIKPHSHGGNNSLTNLVCSCQKCNNLVHNRVFTDFYTKKSAIQELRLNKGLPVSLYSRTQDHIYRDPDFFFSILRNSMRHDSYFNEFVLNDPRYLQWKKNS
jgi:5-methylcytosine-specific restriction endonuclease McrA